MSDYTLSIPEDLYTRIMQIARETSRPVDQVILDSLRQLAAGLPLLPPDEEAELDALKGLSDDALWTIAREQMPEADQRQMQFLMDQHSQGTISPAEKTELTRLVERGQRLLLRKSEAAALLTQRGHRVSQSSQTR